MQVLVSFDGGGMIAIFPERSLLTFSVVLLLGRAPCDELHALHYNVCASVFNQEMNVVRRNYIIENRQAVTLPRLEQPI